ncbi:hypothetical protein SUGI_0127300 [Cryptomeria japonica]|uniref:ethylene-responsive transcription factor ERF016 n=1 Tax=Cryptomeria japonica TaxID=3369 RepID=UPI002408A37A|nr:ethylene-responsive transcription factor ERF016 [Cryptomeria japonica]GLJ10389.1 hypothetical protein SUGI_0127300 [Cryptomeria japonica]
MVKTLANREQHTTLEHSQDKAQQFKGVRMRKWGKWVSEVRVPNSRVRIWLGSYDFPYQAARAYDCAIYCLRGSQAKFNFPDSLPEIPSASSLSPAQIQSVAAKFALQEFRQVPDNGAVFSASKSQFCMERQQILEEDGLTLLDSLLGDMTDFEDFPTLEEVVENSYFPILAEEQRGLFPQRTEDLREFPVGGRSKGFEGQIGRNYV